MAHYPYVLGGKQFVFHCELMASFGFDRIDPNGSGVTTTTPRVTGFLLRYTDVAICAAGDAALLVYEHRPFVGTPEPMIVAAMNPNGSAPVSFMVSNHTFSASSVVSMGDHGLVFGLAGGALQAVTLTPDGELRPLTTPMASLPLTYGFGAGAYAFLWNSQPHVIFDASFAGGRVPSLFYAEVFRFDGNAFTSVAKWDRSEEAAGTIVPFLVGGVLHVLQFANMRPRVDAVGDPMVTRWKSDRGLLMGDSVMVYTRGDYGYVVEQRSDRQVTIYRLSPRDTGSENVCSMTCDWRTDTGVELVVLTMNGKTFLAAYSPEFYPLGIDCIDPIGNGLVATWRADRTVPAVDPKVVEKKNLLSYITLLVKEARRNVTADRVIAHLLLWTELGRFDTFEIHNGRIQVTNRKAEAAIADAARRDYAVDFSADTLNAFLGIFFAPAGNDPNIVAFLRRTATDADLRHRIATMTAEQIVALAAQSGFSFTAGEYRNFLEPFATIAMLFQRLRDNHTITDQQFESVMGGTDSQDPASVPGAANQLVSAARLFVQITLQHPEAGSLFSVLQFPLAAVSETWAEMVIGGIEGRSYSWSEAGDMFRDNYSATLEASADALQGLHSML